MGNKKVLLATFNEMGTESEGVKEAHSQSKLQLPQDCAFDILTVPEIWNI